MTMPLPGLNRYKCKVPFCKSAYYSQISNKKYTNKHFFRVPCDVDRKRRWLDAISNAFNISFTCPIKKAYICEDHFTADCYNGGIRNHLLPSAVPSMFQNTFSKSIYVKSDNNTTDTVISNDLELLQHLLESETYTNKEQQFVTPSLNKIIVDGLYSAVGIYVNNSGISWTKIDTQNSEVQEWSLHDFSSFSKPIKPDQFYYITQQVIQQLPEADVYVMQMPATLNLEQSNSEDRLLACNEQLQLSSILLALINSTFKHVLNGKRIEFNGKILQNKVYYLQTGLCSRLFQSLMNNNGNRNETVGDVVTKLLDSQYDNFPCIPVTTSSNIKTEFMKQTPVYKDLLSESLMLIITFINLCVYKNHLCLEMVNKNSISS